MDIKITIPGTMPGFNEIIKASKQGNRRYQPYNDMKRENTQAVIWLSKKIGKKKRIFLDITWIEKNRMRDPDNIAAAVKFIFDGLVDAEIIENDNWKCNIGWSNDFKIDKENPRVVVKIEEVSNES